MNRATHITLFLIATPFGVLRAQTGSVEGTVSEYDTGSPVPRAVVSLAGTDWSAVTNDNGYFSIQGVPVGVYDVHVEAAGFEPAVQPNSTVNDQTPTRLHFQLDVDREGDDRTIVRASRGVAFQPGLGIGGSVGVDGFAGGSSGSVQSGAGFDVFLRFGTRLGLFVQAGGHFSNHGIAQGSPPYHLSAAYAEPRFVALNLSPRLAPFIMGRFGRNWESVEGPTVQMTASGYSFGGGGGVALRLAPQVSMETGFLIGVMTFGAYTFQGDLAWKSCLDGLQSGAPLPESVAQCTGSRSLGGVADFCYPPYFVTNTSSCTPPDIPYANTERTTRWLRLWIGLNVSFKTADEPQ